jgi:hypothetical protein
VMWPDAGDCALAGGGGGGSGGRGGGETEVETGGTGEGGIAAEHRRATSGLGKCGTSWASDGAASRAWGGV